MNLSKREVLRRMASVKLGNEAEVVVPVERLEEDGITLGGYGHGNGIAVPHYGLQAHGGWVAGYDSSLNTYRGVSTDRPMRGVEFSSAPVQGEAGIASILGFYDYLRTLDTEVNFSCGNHIHVGIESLTEGFTREQTINYIMKVAKLASCYHIALYASTGSKRRYDCSYASLISDYQKQRAITNAKNGQLPRIGRTTYLNTEAYSRHSTLEFRVFAGTTNTLKMANSLWMCLALCETALHLRAPRWTGNYMNPQDGRKALDAFYTMMGDTARQYAPIEERLRPMRKTARRMADKFTAGFTPPELSEPIEGTLPVTSA